jgi:hypothetical protein
MLLDQAVQEVIFAKIASEHFVKIPNRDLLRKYTHQLVEWLVQFINPEYVEIFCLNFTKLIADNIRNNLKHTKRSDVKAAFLEISREVIGNYILSVGHELEEKLQAENSESAPMDAETESQLPDTEVVSDTETFASVTQKQKSSGSATKSWWDITVEEEASKGDLTRFHSAVGSLRKEFYGMTVSEDIVIPKNFDTVFPKAYQVIEHLAKKLDIRIIVSPYFIDTTSLKWLPFFQKDKIAKDELIKLDPEHKFVTAWLALHEALDFLLVPAYIDRGQQGPDLIKHLLALGLQVRKGHRPKQVEPTLVYGPNVIPAFETCIRPLIPNYAEFGEVMVAMFKNIVNKFLGSEIGAHYTEVNAEFLHSLYKNDSAIFALSFSRIKQSRLTAAGKAILAKKGKPGKGHYEDYIAIIKPSVATTRVALNENDLILAKEVNSCLQCLEKHIPLSKDLDQVSRKNEANHIIKLLNVKCSKVNAVASDRGQRAHNTLIDNEKRHREEQQLPAPKKGAEKDKFTTEMWREVLKPIVDNEDYKNALRQNFLSDEHGKIVWSDLNKNINKILHRELN